MLYFDNNATTRPAGQVVEAMRRACDQWWANPSSVHRFGQEARRQVEQARESLAGLLNCDPMEIIFTSGATESNNLALRGLAAVQPDRSIILTTALEHPSISQPLGALAETGYTIEHAPLQPGGRVDVAAFEQRLDRDADRIAFASVHWVNNETGVIQPVKQLADCCGAREIAFHTDATQAVGKMPIDLADAPIAALSLSAHKFHGPKGVGALFLRRSQPIQPQMLGGHHENQRRAGTENTPGIVGLGVAADLARSFLESDQSAQLVALRDRFENQLTGQLPDTSVNGIESPRLWTTANIGFARLQAEAIVLLLSEKNLCASAGAACASGSLEPSPVLLAMGIDEPIAHGSVRFSISRYTTDDEIDRALQIIPPVIAKLKDAFPSL